MTIDLPVESAALGLTDEQFRVALAVGLYARQLVTMGQGARIAGIPYVKFMQEMGDSGVCLNYSEDDLLHDIETVEKLSRKPVTA